MQLLKCIPDTFLPTLDTTLRNELYVKSELMDNEFNVNIESNTGELIHLSNNQTVTISDVLTTDAKDLLLINPQVPFFTREPFISSGEDEYYESRKSQILKLLESKGLNLNEDEVFEDLPFKYISDMLGIPDVLERNRALGIHNAILDEENITLGDYFNIIEEYGEIPDLGYNLDNVKSFEEYHYLNNYIPNKNYMYLLNNIKELGTKYYESLKQSLSNRSLEILLKNLKRLTSVEYKFVKTDKFKARIKYGVVEISTNATKQDVFHEYLHPFILALQKENPELYNTLIQTPEVINLAASIRNVETYKDYAEEEALVRVLTDRYDSNIFKEFFNWLKLLFKKILGLDNTVDLSKLSDKTTMQDIINIMTSSKIIDINSQHYILQERYNISIKHSNEQLKTVEAIDGVAGVGGFVKYILIYKEKNTDIYSFKEDDTIEQDSWYILETNKDDAQKYIDGDTSIDILSMLCKRASNYIDDINEAKGTPKQNFTDIQKDIGKSSSEVGTLYHKMIELFNDYIKKTKDNSGTESLEGKFTKKSKDHKDAVESDEYWEKIKNDLLRRFLTFGNVKLYTQEFKHKELVEDKDGNLIAEIDRVFEGYDKNDITNLEYMFAKLHSNEPTKNADILKLIRSVPSLNKVYEVYEQDTANDTSNPKGSKIIKDLKDMIGVSNDVHAITQLEEQLKLYSIFVALERSAPVMRESVLDGIFRTYATYLSPVVVKRYNKKGYDNNQLQYPGSSYTQANYTSSYNMMASVNNVDVINAYEINSDFFKTMEAFIKAHSSLPYYDSKNYMNYADTVLESFREIYRNIYEYYGEDCIIINEKTVGYLNADGVFVVGTIDGTVVGTDRVDKSKVKVGILDYKTVGRKIFNDLTNTEKRDEKKLVQDTIAKYGEKQYLYQEILGKLLNIDISDISNALFLVNLDRTMEYSLKSIKQYLTDLAITDNRYVDLLKELNSIDTTIIDDKDNETKLKYITRGEVTHLLSLDDDTILDPTVKENSKILNVIASINRIMIANRKIAVDKEFNTGDYTGLTILAGKIAAAEAVDKRLGYTPDKSVINRPKINEKTGKFNVHFTPIYYDSEKALPGFNEDNVREIQGYRSLINTYINYIETTLQNSIYQEEEYQSFKKFMDNSLAKLKELRNSIDSNMTGIADKNTLLQVVFGMVNHNKIMEYIHNIGYSAKTTNAFLNKNQVMLRQTYTLSMNTKEVKEATRINAESDRRELLILEKEKEKVLDDIARLKLTAKVIAITNGVIVYDNPELNTLNDKYSSILHSIDKIESDIKEYLSSIAIMDNLIAVLNVIYESRLKEFDIEKLYNEVSYMRSLVVTYLDDIEKPIWDTINAGTINIAATEEKLKTDLAIKVAKFAVIEKIINVYGSFSSMLNTNTDFVEVDGKNIPVKKVITELDYDLFGTIRDANEPLYDKINTLTNDFNDILKKRANKVARRFVADVVIYHTNSDVVSQNSLKDLEIAAMNFKNTLKELIQNPTQNRKFIPAVLSGYYNTLKKTGATADIKAIEDILITLNETTTDDVFDSITKELTKINDTYYQTKMKRYIENRKAANNSEFRKLEVELDKNPVAYTDAIFKRLNESFLGASKSSYRVVQLMALINVEIEDNYVTLYSNMIQELEQNTVKAKLDDDSQGLLKMLSNKSLNLKEGSLNFNIFLAKTEDKLITADYLLKNYDAVFDDDDLSKIKGMSELEISKYIIDAKLVDKYVTLTTNTLVTRGKWNLFERFNNIRRGLLVLNREETLKSMASKFISNKDQYILTHNNKKKPIIKEFIKKINETYYHFDYRYYYLKDYLEDLNNPILYKDTDIYKIDFLKKLRNKLGMSETEAFTDVHFTSMRKKQITLLEEHYSKELNVDPNYVTDLLLDIEQKYDNYKNTSFGKEISQKNEAESRRRSSLIMAYHDYKISYDSNLEPIGDIKPEIKALIPIWKEKAMNAYNASIIDFYKSYSPFSYSEQRSLFIRSSPLTVDTYFDNIFKASEFYKASNLHGVNIVYLPKVTADRSNLDDSFDNLLNGKPEHYEYYTYLKSVVAKLHEYIPYDKRNSKNPLELPAIEEGFWEKLSQIHGVKDLKNISREDLIALVKDNITAFIPNNYENPVMNVNTLANTGLEDYKELRKNTKNLSRQLDKTIQLFMFEVLIHKSRLQHLPLNRMLLNLTKDTDNTMLRESSNFAFIQNITGGSIRNIKDRDKKSPTLSEADKKEQDYYRKEIIELEKQIKENKAKLLVITQTTGYPLNPALYVEYYTIVGNIDNLKNKIKVYENIIETINNRNLIDMHNIERNLHSVVKLAGLSYNLTGQVNNLLMGFIQTKNRAMGSPEERDAYNEAFAIMNNIMKPEFLMTLSGIAANQVVSSLVPIPIVNHFAGFVAQMLVMSKVGTTLEKKADEAAKAAFGDDKSILRNFILTPNLVKFINMNINYNFTSDITEEGKTGKPRRRLTLNDKNQSIDTKNQLVNLLQPYSYIKRAELFVAMLNMIIQANIDKIIVNGEEVSFADIHGEDGYILDKYKPYVSEAAITLFRTRTLSRLSEANGNYREKIQIESLPFGKSIVMYQKWAFEAFHHMFHGITSATDNVFTGQKEGSAGTVPAAINQIRKSYFKIIKKSVLIDKSLSDAILANPDEVDLNEVDIPNDPSMVMNFINRYAKNLDNNLNSRIIFYDRGSIVTNHQIINDFIEARRLYLSNVDPKTDKDEMRTKLEDILNEERFKDIRLLRLATGKERADSIQKTLSLFGQMMLPTNHIPDKFSFLKNRFTKDIGDILNTYVTKDAKEYEKLDEFERAYNKGLAEYISATHAWISWTYYRFIETIIFNAMIGLFDLDKEDEVFQILQSFDNKFNKLYQDVVFLNSSNPHTKFFYAPTRLAESTFSPLKFYNNRVIPMAYDVAAIPFYTASELVTSEDGIMEGIMEDMYKSAGMKHPYVEDATGQITNWRLINDGSKIVPLVNRLGTWERDENVAQQVR